MLDAVRYVVATLLGHLLKHFFQVLVLLIGLSLVIYYCVHIRCIIEHILSLFHQFPLVVLLVSHC